MSLKANSAGATTAHCYMLRRGSMEHRMMCALSSTKPTGSASGVILDVVYNHFGVGERFSEFTPDYLTERYSNEWGKAINFDGPNSHGVREYIAKNAAYWIDEFHFDGLRIDATQALF